MKRTIAATNLLLISPAVLFMTALFVRNVQPQQYEPAHTAQRIVMWYAGRLHLGLWVLLIALPLTVLATGGATLLRSWNDDAQLRQATRQALTACRSNPAMLLIAATTVTAAGILAIVALHVLTD
jgi:cytochrome b561